MNPPRPRLSAVLITRNEAAEIADCLATLAFADEIVVVDHASTDGTAALAEGCGARVIVVSDWPGFGLQKQRAVDAAGGEWILSVDADERVTPALQAAILAALSDPQADGYRIPRRTYFLGRFLRHGGWYPDRVLRLARRARARFSPDPVHERMLVDGPVEDLAADLEHHSYRSIAEVLDKQRRYALASAERRRSDGRRGGLAVALARSHFAFWRHYLIQRGFLDGAHGFVAATAKAQETFWRYLSAGWER